MSDRDVNRFQRVAYLGWKLAHEKRMGEEIKREGANKRTRTERNADAEQSMRDRSYGERIDELPADIRRELRKFVCPYTLVINHKSDDYDVVLRFSEVTHIITIAHFQENNSRLGRMLDKLAHTELMKEGVVYHEAINFYDGFYFDRSALQAYTLRVVLTRPDREFIVPIYRVLIDALTWVYENVRKKPIWSDGEEYFDDFAFT